MSDSGDDAGAMTTPTPTPTGKTEAPSATQAQEVNKELNPNSATAVSPPTVALFCVCTVAVPMLPFQGGESLGGGWCAVRTGRVDKEIKQKETEKKKKEEG